MLMLIFINEKYVLSREILIELPNHGLGIKLPMEDLSKAILSGKVSPNLVVNRDFLVLP